MLVRHLDLVGLGLAHDLQREDIVDVGGLEHESAGAVDGVLVAFGCLERGIGGVFVDGDHVQVGVVALVDEELVVSLGDDQIPRVDGLCGTHEHGEDAVGGEDGSLVLIGEVVQDGVARGSDVVGGALEDVEFALRGDGAGLLVVAAVVVVEEAVAVDVLALAGGQIQLAQARKVNLLQHLPVGLDLHRGITVALGLVVSPTKAAATPAASAAAVVVLLAAAAADALEGAPAAALCLAAALPSAPAKDGATSPAEAPCPGGCACVVDDGEGGLLLGHLDGEGVRRLVRAVHLLVCTRSAMAPAGVHDASGSEMPYPCSYVHRSSGGRPDPGPWSLSSRPCAPACLPWSRVRTGRRRAWSRQRPLGPMLPSPAVPTRGRGAIRAPWCEGELLRGAVLRARSTILKASRSAAEILAR